MLIFSLLLNLGSDQEQLRCVRPAINYDNHGCDSPLGKVKISQIFRKIFVFRGIKMAANIQDKENRIA
jgi:hypothetical protein